MLRPRTFFISSALALAITAYAVPARSAQVTSADQQPATAQPGQPASQPPSTTVPPTAQPEGQNPAPNGSDRGATGTSGSDTRQQPGSSTYNTTNTTNANQPFGEPTNRQTGLIALVVIAFVIVAVVAIMYSRRSTPRV